MQSDKLTVLPCHHFLLSVAEKMPVFLSSCCVLSLPCLSVLHTLIFTLLLSHAEMYRLLVSQLQID